MRNARVSSLLALGLSFAAPACSAAPPPPPPPPPAPSASAAPPPPPARWIAQYGPTDPGVRLPKGTLALVGGRRALVADGGATEEAKAGPVDLDRLEIVPAAGGPRVVGIGGQRVHRFDDPLGEGRAIGRVPRFSGVSTWPGLVGFRVDSGETLWMDLDGKPSAGPATPLVPTRVAFLDEKRGLALFPASGVAHTTDGGATWTLVDTYPSPDFDARDGDLRMGASAVTPAGALAERPKRAEPPLLQFLRGAQLSPLEAAARVGVPVAGGKALVAAGGDLYTIDLASGAVAPWASLMPSYFPGMEAEAGVWQGALVPHKSGQKLLFFTAYESLGPGLGGVPIGYRPLVGVDLATKSMERLSDFAGMLGSVVVSTTGGMLWPGPCQESESGPPELRASCVRQPDGSFLSVWHNLDDVGQGPTLAGGLVGWTTSPEDGGRELLVVSKDGKSRSLGKVCGAASCEPTHPVDELAEGTYSALVEVPVPRAYGNGVGVVTVEGAAPPKLERVSALLYAPRAYARGKGAVEANAGLRITTDGGRSWHDVPSRLAGGGHDLSVGELGLTWGRHVRLGWGVAEGEAPPKPLPEDGGGSPTLTPRAAPKAQKLACEGAKDARVPPLWHDARGADALAPAPPKGMNATGQTLASSLRTHARVEVLTDKDGKKKAQLVARWVDQTELGAKVRTATVELASTSAPRLGFSFALARGDRALFVVALDGVTHFARANGGKLELVEARDRRAPRDAALAPDGAVAWVGDDGVGHWAPKGKPALVARVRPAQLAVGAPTKEGIPLVVGEKGWASFRVLPIPKGDPASPPPWLDVGGWRRAGFAPGELAALPACGAKAPAHRFVFQATTIGVAIPGAAQSRATALGVRTDGATACLETVSARLAGEGWARIDVTKKKGEGATNAKAAYALTCKLE